MTIRCVAVTLTGLAAVSALLNLLGLFGDEGRAARARAEADQRAIVAARARSVRQISWGSYDYARRNKNWIER